MRSMWRSYNGLILCRIDKRNCRLRLCPVYNQLYQNFETDNLRFGLFYLFLTIRPFLNWPILYYSSAPDPIYHFVIMLENCRCVMEGQHSIILGLHLGHLVGLCLWSLTFTNISSNTALMPSPSNKTRRLQRAKVGGIPFT